MEYYQEVSIKNVTFDKVVSSFNNIKIVKFLTQLQPIQIIEWDGIEDGKVAHFKLWFFGWKNFIVIHSDYSLDENELSFVDNGQVLPLELKSWRHKHSVINKNGYVKIIDHLQFNHNSSIIGYLLYPLLVSPIFLRKLLYRLYFR
ncbi:MAG: hypothetical protein CMG07_00575 [Candidatus Marinimicrobia bacterium]|nr:hypothetical protein [Candidatus Neomarinimicrobiota bacterium]|tara:strand:+ start:983 stop:1417 length:435 start_codon:yes stop_codon:yes gene_type:complete